MNVFENCDIKKINSLVFDFMDYKYEDHVFSIILNRPQKKNALHPQMINELAFLCQYAQFEKKVKVVLIKAVGDVFCAGFDLSSMSGKTAKTKSTVPSPKTKIILGEILNKLYKPKICQLDGDLYAGGLLIVSSCNYVVSTQNIIIGLPEVKRGIFPFQVMESLFKVINYKKLIDWCIRGYNLDASKAKDFGLIDEIVDSDELEKSIKSWISEIIQNSTQAISLGLECADNLYNSSNNHRYLSKMLKKSSESKDAREGIKAFFDGRKPKWD